MKLQLALDEHKLEDAIAFVENVADYVDIIEIGTPFVIDSGMEGVRRFKERFPDKEILSDEKIMDGGYYESQLGFEAGAEYVTVLGVTDLLTIKNCLNAAKDFNKKIVVDMICVEDIPTKIQEVEELGVHVLAVHTGADQQAAGHTPLDDLKMMTQHTKKAQIAVAGGINSNTIKEYVKLNPDIIIVGSGITRSEDPSKEIKLIKEAMEEYSKKV
ncbi:3-hexulose-6-phosphate synthase [Tetragenococcus halophilus subsp. flandriensis]|uniref:3-hexulose-6-phosphate synthase n=1 Tax=Tetragenococcus halophilus TaxID=51669 RepID=UPI0023E94D73|nr:3-hexulose-6-phosphate synthase [Tetragenococcus halophilus]GMA08819.1 3-hexulose-6-phosphate synthase [Tetragenococcus halophilus subsp. flandriensis]